MADPRFYSAEGPFTLARLAQIGDAELHGNADPERRFFDVAPLDAAGTDNISFLQNPRYVDQFRVSAAGACVVRSENVRDAPDSMALLVSDNPHKSYARIAQSFYPPPRSEPGISPAAFVHESARIGEGSSVAPGAVIGARAEIGRNCQIGENAVVGEGVILGSDGRIGACVSLAYAVIGDRVRISAGARIGEDGFGFAMDPDTPVNVPQIGRVVIGDDVEIGSNSAVDRGAGPDTVIGDGCRIDNLVHIGHNVRIGKGCVLVGQVGMAGSTILEDHVVIAAQAGIAGHLTLGKGARVAARSGVTRNVDAGQTVGGFPAVPFREWLRQSVLLQRLATKRGQ